MYKSAPPFPRADCGTAMHLITPPNSCTVRGVFSGKDSGKASIGSRKMDHINICLNEDVGSRHNYWDDVSLLNNSLPEIDMDDIDTGTDFLGRKLKHPLFIAAMSGGHSRSRELNENCARAASELGIGFCIGSQRAAIESPGTAGSFSVVKDYDIPVKMATVGGVQLIDQKGSSAFTVEQVRSAMDMIGANMLTVFMNVPQEMVQPEGDDRTSGILDAIRELAKQFPVNVKECGFGISGEAAARLGKAGVKSVEVSGLSGTSWTAVEHHRARLLGEGMKERIGKTFWEWGIPSPVSVSECRKAVGEEMKVIGSGGIRNGLDVARAIAMGSDAASMARSILPWAVKGYEDLMEGFGTIIEELRIAMLLTGSRNVGGLRKARKAVTGRTAEWLG